MGDLAEDVTFLLTSEWQEGRSILGGFKDRQSNTGDCMAARNWCIQGTEERPGKLKRAGKKDCIKDE